MFPPKYLSLSFLVSHRLVDLLILSNLCVCRLCPQVEAVRAQLCSCGRHGDPPASAGGAGAAAGPRRRERPRQPEGGPHAPGARAQQGDRLVHRQPGDPALPVCRPGAVWSRHPSALFPGRRGQMGVLGVRSCPAPSWRGGAAQGPACGQGVEPSALAHHFSIIWAGLFQLLTTEMNFDPGYALKDNH